MSVHLGVAVELAEIDIDERGVQIRQETFGNQPLERFPFGVEVVDVILEADQL